MIKRVLYTPLFIIFFSLAGFAKSDDLRRINIESHTITTWTAVSASGRSYGEYGFYELKPYLNQNDENELMYLLHSPIPAWSALATPSRVTPSVFFGKSIINGKRTFWLELTARRYVMSSAGTAAFDNILIDSFRITSNQGIMSFKIDPNKIRRFDYVIIYSNNSKSHPQMLERYRINLTEEQFIAIRDYTHLAVEFNSKSGIIGPFVIENRTWARYQAKMQKLYDISLD
ncbi:hypothetical protein PVA45_07585 (plasmid) [Entomospira entomophila]|uniref:Uncharacterized protein n=1 Tax=Entomospira entomophila TaxID=2719988 RepID=A0A968KRZ7_9SPIO|nr:hypothetical protein [Entomospira entomophilus]NIZ41278.1 hypothetical protein [Entomospira entomophilus]WDI36194.1 hypothetical protein PVA45_07585 [Entomospira entomophilus]